MGAITRIDNPVTLRERVDRGDIVVNYGLQVVYRNQGDVAVPDQSTHDDADAARRTARSRRRRPRSARRCPLGAWSVTPDVWLKLHYKALTLEFEGIGIFGQHRPPGHAGDEPTGR